MSDHDQTDMEMIIIKRGHAHEEHPHGGAWKVAFADFMTAMFAFFLVLWIINSTNKETRSSVARYFNPIRISDTTPARKGLKDPKEADFDAAAADEKAKPKTGVKSDINGDSGQNSGTGSKAEANSEKPDAKAQAAAGGIDPITARDPFVVLDEIAGPVTGASSAEALAVSAEVDLVADGPQPFRDPFAPPSPVLPPQAKPMLKLAAKPTTANPPKADLKGPSRAIEVKADDKSGGPADADTLAMIAATAKGPAQKPAIARQAIESMADVEADKPMDKAAEKAAERAIEKASLAKATGDVDQPAKAGPALKQAVAEASALKKDIAAALRESGLEQGGPKLDVKVVDDGVLISLTDDLNFGMFAVGSAEPQKRVVRAMEKIGQILKAQNGNFIIRGHTDGRAYRSRAYDNWRLSSARAQMAAYMLVRGSLEEKRIERVEGHADRSLRVPTDPNAAENRRIEILLRKPK